jgi:hypothetical protein
LDGDGIGVRLPAHQPALDRDARIESRRRRPYDKLSQQQTGAEEDRHGIAYFDVIACTAGT